MGVIESAPFQKRRNTAGPPPQPKADPKAKKTTLLPGNPLEIQVFSIDAGLIEVHGNSACSFLKPS
jgi:hypothetical protein